MFTAVVSVEGVEKKDNPVFLLRASFFRVGNGAVRVWKKTSVFHGIRMILSIPKESTLQTRILWKTYPSRMRVLMLSIVSAKDGSSSIILEIFSHAEIAVV